MKTYLRQKFLFGPLNLSSRLDAKCEVRAVSVQVRRWFGFGPANQCLKVDTSPHSGGRINTCVSLCASGPIVII